MQTYRLDGSYKYLMGCSVSEDNYYSRVFPQSLFPSMNVTLGCLEVGLMAAGASMDLEVTVYLDSDGGAPDDSMTLLGTLTGTIYNAGGSAEIVTVDASGLLVEFTSASQTLVVEVKIPATVEGYVLASGELNSNLDSTTGLTYFKGPACGYPNWVKYGSVNGGSFSYNQLYVKVTANDNDDSDVGGDNGNSAALSTTLLLTILSLLVLL